MALEPRNADAAARRAGRRRGSSITRQAVLEAARTRFLEQISPRLRNVEDADTRAGLASAMLIGVIVGRGVVQVRVLADAERETVIRLVAPAIQTMLAAL